MPTEINYLVASVALFIAMIAVQSLIGISKHGLVPLAGARDALGDDSVMGSRAKRANQNMVEALVIFAPLVLVAQATGNFNETTALGAMLFFFARLVYAPLYWFGVPWLRTIVWGVGLVGTLMILLFSMKQRV